MAATEQKIKVSRYLLLTLLTITMGSHLILCSQLNPDLSPSLHQGPRHRRAVTDKPIQDFLTDLKSSPVDLIILMERSRAVGRHYFNMSLRKLVSHVLRYYAKVGDDNVRLLVATFAADFTVHIDGMADSSLTKCDIWQEYWDKVILRDPPTIWNRTNIMKAYIESNDIFSTVGRSGNKKYIWVLTSGDYKIYQDGDPAAAKKELISAGVQIVSTKVGAVQGLEGQIRAIVSSDNHHGGTPADWQATLEKVGILTDPVNLQLASFDFLDPCYCDHTFGFRYCNLCTSCPCSTPQEDCVCTGSADPELCTKGPQRTCEYGTYGRYCDQKEKECVDYACANGGECVEHLNHYTCNCPPGLRPDYYCENVTTGYIPASPAGGPERASPAIPSVIIIGASAGGGGLVLLLACCITIIVCKKKSRRPRAVLTSTTETYTNPDVLAQTNPMAYNVIPETMDVPHMPPLSKRPTAVIRPVGKTPPPAPDKSLKPKWGRKNMPSMLLRVPIPLWRASVREEVSVTNDKVDSEGQTKDDDFELYENSGHLNMAGWEDYLIELTTTGGLKHFALVRYDRGAYASTSTAWFLPNKSELEHIYSLLSNKQTGSVIGLKAANYRVSKNDGKMLEAFLVGHTLDVLCIGRSKQFLVMGIKQDANNTGDCYKEVKWVRDSLSKQNK